MMKTFSSGADTAIQEQQERYRGENYLIVTKKIYLAIIEIS